MALTGSVGGAVYQNNHLFKTLKKCINVLKYRQSKPVLRKSRTTYDNVELSMKSSLNTVYYGHCYKLFTAIKIPPDFQNLNQELSVVEHDNASEVSGESSESHAPIDSATTQAAGTSTDK